MRMGQPSLATGAPAPQGSSITHHSHCWKASRRAEPGASQGQHRRRFTAKVSTGRHFHSQGRHGAMLLTAKVKVLGNTSHSQGQHGDTSQPKARLRNNPQMESRLSSSKETWTSDFQGFGSCFPGDCWVWLSGQTATES